MNKLARYIIIVAIIALIAFVAWYFSNILAYVIVAAVLSIIGRPLVQALAKLRMKRYRLPRALCAAVALLAMWSVFLAIFFFLVPAVVNLINPLSGIDIPQTVQGMGDMLANVQRWIVEHVPGVPPDFSLSDIVVGELTGIGSSAGLRVGERIYAVGNPSRLDYTMTDGLVSALDRAVQVESQVSIDMFQISAAVNRGNSGGPVYNTRGEVVGIVSAKYISEGTEGLGFAIPMDDAMRIATELITNGYVSGKASLGIRGRDVDSQTAEYYGWPEGVVVREVTPGSAADKAGIQVGDTIVALGDVAVKTIDALNIEKKNYKAGDKVKITIVRNGNELTLDVTFDEDTAGT
jgi:membrane-associated protease RseP (regulator of RpoE activity)